MVTDSSNSTLTQAGKVPVREYVSLTGPLALTYVRTHVGMRGDHYRRLVDLASPVQMLLGEADIDGRHLITSGSATP